MKLNNTSKYLVIDSIGDTNWWSWTAFIDEITEEELDSIEYVEYHLHPSFRNPIKRSRSKRNNFSITVKGWGVFELTARVKFKGDKKNLFLTHKLEFEDTL